MTASAPASQPRATHAYPYNPASERHSNLPMIVPVALLVAAFTLIFSFSYVGSDQWYIGAVIAVVGLSIVLVMLFATEDRERKHRRELGLGWAFDKKLLVLGSLTAMAGMILLLYGASVLSSFVSLVVAGLGLGLVVAGVAMMVVSMRG